MLRNIKDLTIEELTEYFKEKNQPGFKAKQCFKWLSQGVSDFSEMTDISKDLRKSLSEDFFISVPEISRKQVSKDKTVKYLFKNTDGTYIETVVMTYKHGISACLSTQVGCNMGCKFCASTIGGKERNLTAGEILDQIIYAGKDMGVRISHVVLMGMGEPLDNYDEVVHFLKNVTNPLGLNLSYRHISLSTCGIVPKIEMLMKEKMPITLSISLHAPTDEKRNQIMPVNKKYNISTLMAALRKYIEYTGRRISFEYTLIKDFNDSYEDAKKLSGLLKGMLAHVNLIPVNEVTETGYKKPENVNRFKEWLTGFNINATVRRELGSDIDAACGQLRKKEMK